MSNQTNVPKEESSLSEKLKERRQESKEQTHTQQKSDDSDLGYELHEDLARQQNNNANAWRFG